MRLSIVTRRYTMVRWAWFSVCHPFVVSADELRLSHRVTQRLADRAREQHLSIQFLQNSFPIDLFCSLAEIKSLGFTRSSCSEVLRRSRFPTSRGITGGKRDLDLVHAGMWLARSAEPISSVDSLLWHRRVLFRDRVSTSSNRRSPRLFANNDTHESSSSPA